MQRQAIRGKKVQKAFRQSDQLVVLKKQGNACGEKGLEKMREDARGTSAGHRTGKRMSTKLASLTSRARENPKYRFMTLMNLFTEENLLECFWELRKNKAPGIDGMSVEEYESNLAERIKSLCMRVREWKYKPKPVRRAYIPKSDGTKRGLGIPVVEDKIVQVWIKRTLEAIYEVDFLDVSYGFRPGRKCHDALAEVDKAVMTKPVNCVVDMDISKYFDTINHEWMMKCLRQRVSDMKFLKLIGRFLVAGIMEEGKLIRTEKGTPQGGNLSPVLANIYLHYVLDLWFQKVKKRSYKGYTQLIRYADDFVVCLERRDEAEAFGMELAKRLEKFGLKIAEGKSRTIEFGRNVWRKSQVGEKGQSTFDFLGFTHYCDKTRRGKFKLGRKTSSKRFKQKVSAMNEWLKEAKSTNTLQETWTALGQKLEGHYNYYGISGNMQWINQFHRESVRLVYKWFNRRSQKKSYRWNQFESFMRYNPLPTPKIYHSMHRLSNN